MMVLSPNYRTSYFQLFNSITQTSLSKSFLSMFSYFFKCQSCLKGETAVAYLRSDRSRKKRVEERQSTLQRVIPKLDKCKQRGFYMISQALCLQHPEPESKLFI